MKNKDEKSYLKISQPFNSIGSVVSNTPTIFLCFDFILKSFSNFGISYSKSDLVLCSPIVSMIKESHSISFGNGKV